MTILQDVERFVARLKPQPVCDACIGRKLGQSAQIVARKTRQLAGSDGFERRIDVCGLCNGTKSVIRHR